MDVPVGEVETTGFWVNATSTEFPVLVNSATGSGAIGQDVISQPLKWDPECR